MDTIVATGSRLTAPIQVDERNTPNVVVTAGPLTDAPTPPNGRSRSRSEPIPFTPSDSLLSESFEDSDEGNLTMSGMSDIINFIDETSAEEFGETQNHPTEGVTVHQNVLDTFSVIDGDLEPPPETTENASIDQIAGHLKFADEEFGFDGDEAIARPPLNPFPSTRYDSTEWTGDFVERDESQQSVTPTSFLDDLDQPEGVDGPRFAPLHAQDLGFEPRPQATIGSFKSILSGIADKLRSVATKFVQLFESREQSLDRKVADFGKQVAAYRNGGEVIPTFQGPTQALDRIDRLIAGGESKVDVRGAKALSVFSGNFEGEVTNAGGQRSEKLAELSNHLTTMLADLKEDAADPKRNPARLSEKDFIEVGIKTMIGSATIADLQTMSTESLEELCGCLGAATQGEKAGFVRELITQLETFPSLTDSESIASHREKLLNEADGARVTPKRLPPKEGEREIPPEAPLNYKRMGLDDVLKGTPEQVSVQLTKLLGVLAQDVDKPERNHFEMNPVAFRQAAFVKIMQHSDASTLRGVDLEATRNMVGFFLDRGQPEKAQAMSELADLIASARTEEGARVLFEDVAKNGLAKANKLETFLRSSAEETASAIKKMVDTTDATSYAKSVRGILERFAAGPAMTRLNDQLQRPSDPRGKIKTFTDDRITLALGVSLAEAAKELLAELIKVPVPEGMRSLLAEFTEVLQSGDVGSDKFVNKLYADQIFLKLIAAQITEKPAIGPPTNLVVNFLQVVANGITDQEKWATNAREAYSVVNSTLRTTLEDYFVQGGMPDSARTI